MKTSEVVCSMKRVKSAVSYILVFLFFAAAFWAAIQLSIDGYRVVYGYDSAVLEVLDMPHVTNSSTEADLYMAEIWVDRTRDWAKTIEDFWWREAYLDWVSYEERRIREVRRLRKFEESMPVPPPRPVVPSDAPLLHQPQQFFTPRQSPRDLRGGF